MHFILQVVDARAGPGTKSFVKIKSRKNIKPKIKNKKHIEEEEMDNEPKKVFENDDVEFEVIDIAGMLPVIITSF